jgi:predicted phosphodiesterase
VRVAALYDVHGNPPALEAVLAEVPDDAVIVLGGDVAVGPLPSEALERLRGLGDRELTPGEDALGPPEVLEWVRSQLTAEQIGFLHALPEQVELDVDGLGRVLFCHASPRNDVDIFLEGTPEDHVAPLFDGVGAGTVVCGHTHMQFSREIGGTSVVNAGSVGMPYEDEPGAYWALLGPGIEHRRTEYDPSGLEGSAFPGGYFREDRPTKAEVTDHFAPHAVGA